MRKMKKNKIHEIVLLVIAVTLMLLPTLDAFTLDPEYVSYNEATKTYTIRPTGNDDTENIQNVLDTASSLGSGYTVELTAGEFLLSKPVQVADFDGTFKGTGKGETVIRNKEGVLFPLAEPPVGLWPYYFVFYLEELGSTNSDPASITISDMTLVCDDLSDTWYITFPGSVGSFEIPFSDYNPICVFGKYKGVETRVIDGEEYQVHAGEKGFYDIDIKRIRVEGLDTYEHPWGWGEMSNVHNGIVVQGWLETYPVNENTFIFYGAVPNQGDTIVSDCTVIDPQYGIFLSDQEYSKITVKNNKITNSFSTASAYYGVELSSLTDSRIYLWNNEIEGFFSGINAYSNSHLGTAYRNKISATVSGIKLDQVHGWTVKFNEFYDMQGSAINCSGSHNVIMMNYYRNSGLSGMTDSNPDGPCCVYLHDTSSNNLVWETRYPADTSSESQVLDMGENNYSFIPYA
jgi:hypothetical protein